MFSSTPGLHLLGTSSSPPSCDDQKMPPDIAKCPLEEKNYSSLRAAALKRHVYNVNKNAKCAWTFKPKEPPQKILVCAPSSIL